MRRNRKKLIAALGVAVLVIALASAAFAYWTTTGNGVGSATTGSDSGVTITATTSPSGLVPGGPAQALDFDINNGATTPQYVNTVAISITGVTGPNITVGTPCDASDFALEQPNAIGQDLASGTTSFAPSGASIALIDSGSNQNGCKGATVALSYDAS